MNAKVFPVALAIALIAPPVVADTLKAQALATVIGLDGAPLGEAKFTQTSRGVLIELDLHGLPSGVHAVHIHGSGVCEPTKHFASAGPHLSLEPRAHGYFAKGGPHEGDLPNQFAARDGALHASVITSAFTLGNGVKSIFDRDGASLVVHAKADDYMSQPAGGAGDRIACGVIARTIAPGTRRAPSRLPHI
jgi:Cu-Zn family superoxide dismutase